MNFRLSIGLHLWFLLFYSLMARGQEYQEKLFTIKDGLPSNNISSILRDHRGLIWIGTDNGLAQFDGYSFRVFHHDNNDSTSLSNSRITQLLEDSKQNIWIGTYYGGLNRYDSHSQKFIHYQLPTSQINHIPYQQVVDFTEDEIGRIWIASYNGLFYWDPNKNQVIEYLLDSSITVKNFYNRIINVCTDKKYIYVLTNHGNAVIDIQTMEGYYAGKNQLNIPLLDNISQPSNFFEDSGKIYFWRKNEITGNREWCSYNQSLHLVESRIKDGTTIYKMNYHFVRFDSLHFIALSPGNNLLLFDCSTGKVSNFAFNNVASALNIWITTDVFGSSNVWVLTRHGLCLFFKGSMQINVVKASQLIRQPAPVSAVVALFCSEKNNLWVCTSDGIVVLDSNMNTIKFFSKPQFRERGYDAVWRIIEDRQGKVWIGRQCGYSVFDLYHNSMEDFFLTRNDNTGNNFYVASSFLQSDDSTMWIGSNKGLANADSRTGKIRKWYVFDASVPAAFPLHRVNNLFKDKRGNNWIMDEEELFSFDPVKMQFRTVEQVFQIPSNLPTRGVKDVTLQDHEMLLATATGLESLNLESKQLRGYTYSDGLPNDYIFSINPENDSISWLMTGSGLSRFDIIHGTFTNYSQMNEFVFDENDVTNMVRLTNGNFMLGIDSNLIQFNPQNMKAGPHIPPANITLFEADNRTFFIPEDSSQLISLDWNETLITIDYSTLLFSDAGIAQYQYRLEGVDPRWNNALENNQVNYSNLPSGLYHFDVRASYGNGIWGKPANLLFRIATPFWKATWFIVLSVLLILSIPLLIVWNLFSRQQSTLQQQQKVNRERQRISAELHDDIGSTLTKIALMSRTIESDPDENKNTLTKMSSVAGHMVNQMNEIIWALNIRNDTLQNLLSYIRKFTSEFLEEEKYSVLLEDPSETPNIALSGEVRRNIFLVVKEALHNIEKHSGANEVKLTMTINHSLTISISDNGKGLLHETRPIEGNGLYNMKQRMEQIGGTLQIISPVMDQRGTTISLTLPLKNYTKM